MLFNICIYQMEEEMEHITFEKTPSWDVQVSCVKAVARDTAKPELREELQQFYKAGSYILSG